MAEIPTQRCRGPCGQAYPLTAEYWYPGRGRRFRTTCKRCTLAALNAAKARRKAANAAARAAATPPKPKRHWIPNPTGKGLDRSLSGTWQPKRPPRDPASDFQTALLEAARPHYDEIAEMIVRKATEGEGDMAALKFVADRLAGMSNASQTPLERSLRVLAAARDGEPGEGAPEMD